MNQLLAHRDLVLDYFPTAFNLQKIKSMTIWDVDLCFVLWCNFNLQRFFPQPISKQEFGSIFWPASMHAIGHIAANLSFAAVAISLTHTVKTMEPVFSVVLSKLLLGQNTPAPVLGTLVPIMVRHKNFSPGKASSSWERVWSRTWIGHIAFPLE